MYHNFLMFAGQLKKVKRTGWTKFPIKNRIESVCDHSYRMALMTMILIDNKQIDQAKCMKIALLHDLAESIVGDITPSCGVSDQDKKQRENTAMIQILKDLPENQKNQLYSLWREYEDQSTEEGRFVKDLDKYEMIFQAFQYEQENDVDLQEFYKSKDKIQNEQIRQLVDDLLQKRNQIKQQKQ